MTGNIESESGSSPNGLRWYQGVSRYAWLVLLVAALGWLFDTMDQNLFNLVRNPALTSLLFPNVAAGAITKAQAALVTQNSANMTSIFLLGWAAGGFIFGVLGDRLGRTRTMTLTILIYAVFTGMSGLTHTVSAFGLFRFLTGLGVGGEWAAGAALVSEVFPARSRPMALGMLQALSAVGNIMAATINLFLNSVHITGDIWRWAFAIGAFPALLVLWIRLAVREPEPWQQAKRDAEASGNKELGGIRQLFAEPELRRNTLAATLMAAAGVGGLWGVGFWTPELTKTVLAPLHLPKTLLGQYTSYIFMVQQVGAFFGMYAYAVFAERTTRRLALGVFFVLSYLSIQCMFWLTHDLRSLLLWAPVLGFCTLGPFSAYTVYFPELFPTRLRATGCGFCYNCARLLAAAAPFALGGLAAHFKDTAHPDFGLRMAASIVASIYVVGFIGIAFAPETKGKPLPT
jgi:MFS family permease